MGKENCFQKTYSPQKTTTKNPTPHLFLSLLLIFSKCLYFFSLQLNPCFKLVHARWSIACSLTKTQQTKIIRFAHIQLCWLNSFGRLLPSFSPRAGTVYSIHTVLSNTFLCVMLMLSGWPVFRGNTFWASCTFENWLCKSSEHILANFQTVFVPPAS